MSSGHSVPDPRTAFKDLLDAVRAHLDVRLASWLSPRVAAAHAISAEVGAAAAEVERLTLRGGKRMRAALVAAAFEAYSAARSPNTPHGDAAWLPSVPAMLAIELLQTYLLIHDDWMDDDDVRRGGPSVHVALRERYGSKPLGDAGAVLAGDLASGYAQNALLESDLAPERVLRAARAFAKIQEEVVTGQLAEMCAAGAGGAHAATAPSVEIIHSLKTASYTVTGPLALGAALAGADDVFIDGLARFGRPLGIAFQLRDDLLGVFGDSKATGKPVGNDVRQGKRTALVTELRGQPGADEVLARTLGKADATDAEVDEVVQLMVASGARARVEARVESLLAEARHALEALRLGPSKGHACLVGAVRALGERSS